jgi:hypothetical protein
VSTGVCTGKGAAPMPSFCHVQPDTERAWALERDLDGHAVLWMLLQRLQGVYKVARRYRGVGATVAELQICFHFS